MPGRPPIAVFGLAARNGERHLAEALESLLAQVRDDLRVVVVDDASTDHTADIVRQYAELDPRIVYERNSSGLGLVGNWRRAFDRTRELFPAAPYFAWASDHDVWHPRWLEALAEELDAHPEAVLAYPVAVRIDELGGEYPRRETLFDTAGVTVPAERLRRVSREMPAPGEMIYGLFRADALGRCGPFPLVVLPDRLQLVRLSLEGEFRQVCRRLWYRRYRVGVVMSNRRQRHTFFPGRVPARAYLPWWVVHPVLLARSLGGRSDRVRLGAVLLRDSLRDAYASRRERVRRERRWRRRERCRRYRRLVRRVLERLALLPPLPAAGAGPAVGGELRLADALVALERAEVLEDLTRRGKTVLDLGSPSTLEGELRRRVVDLTYVREEEPVTADLAVSVGAFERLCEEKLRHVVERLHELGVPTLYSFDREADSLRRVLGASYWLHDVWIDSPGRGRKPDPGAGVVPRPKGLHRHIVGRRRLVPDRGGSPG